MIYKVTNLINNKCYIGQTIQRLKVRKRRHINDTLKESNLKFHRALRKYGLNNFKWEIINEENDRDKLNDLEKYYIKFFDCKNNGYNSTDGGDSSNIKETFWNKATKKQRKQHSINISKAKKGKSQTEDYKKQKSKQWFEYWNDENNRKERSIKYSGKGNSNSKYYYKIYKDDVLIFNTYNLREFCNLNNFPLSYVKSCIREDGIYKNYKIIRNNYKKEK